MSRFKFAAGRPCNYVNDLATDQSAASNWERARDQCQSAAVIPPVNLSFSFLSRVSRHLLDFIAIDS